jgi:protein-L-isoaspartate(D-aspartate) O-methyltransferase
VAGGGKVAMPARRSVARCGGRACDRVRAVTKRGDHATSAAVAALIAEIRGDVAATAASTGRLALSERVLAALAGVPREAFVPEASRAEAYANRPLPIGHGQTISQPFIVALMTDLLEPRAEHVVLEVGTGCGYQAAVLAALVRHVYSIEVVDALARSAAERLAGLGCSNVEVRCGNGWHGWPEHAPYDGIIVTAGGEVVPPALVEQLRPGGRLVLPMGPRFGDQQLVVVDKAADGTTMSRNVLPVRFVPFTGAH